MHVEQINMFFDILNATVEYNFIPVYSNTTWTSKVTSFNQ